MSKVELIDANALYSKLVRKTIINFKPFDTWFSGYAHAMAEVEELINDAPIIYPIKHGKWVEEPDRRFRWHCSECGYVIGVVKMDCNYCPKCGARMEGDDNG